MTGMHGAKVYRGGTFTQGSLFLDGGFVVSGARCCDSVMQFDKCYIFPGFVDVHVHLREPGFSYKETIRSGTLAAARGGYTAVCPMPNLSPVPDCPMNLAAQLDAIARDAAVRVLPYGAITRGEKGRELADLAALAPLVLGFSDDGKGVQDEALMRRAMLAAKSLNRPVVAHCEDESLAGGGCVHAGEYAAARGLPGISAESEWRQLERDLRLARETGCAYHMCHVSTAQSVALLRRAKAEGLDVSAETAPHYLLLNDSMLRDEGRFKMNPPIRAERDRQALLEGVRDGTIDMIATDHAPHAPEEKDRGLRGSLMGVSGLEAAFPALYTGLVRSGELTLARLIELMSLAPRRRFGIPGGIEPGEEADLCVVDLSEKFTIDSRAFLSKGKATPFEGMEVYGKVKYTAVKGKMVWQDR